MKQVIVLVLIFVSALFTATVVSASPTLPQITPIIDGAFSDWSGHSILINDPAGDFTPGLDVTELRMTNDSSHLYFMMGFAQPLTGFTYLNFDADNNPDTGHYIIPRNIGLDVGVAIMPGLGFVGDNQDGSFSSSDFPGVLKYAFFDRWVEASIPFSVFSSIVDDYSEMTLYLGNDQTELGFYAVQGNPVPIPGAVWLLGSGLFGLVVTRRRVTAR
jgi:hypothetical protein